MSSDILETTLRRLVDEGLLEDRLAISWHGAEPLMAGRPWYEDAFARVGAILDDRTRITHVFQTNGVLIDPAWCDFLKSHQVRVGVSIDGSDEQNVSRVNWSGRPTHHLARRGVELLNSHGIPWTLLSVVTLDTMREPGAFIDFVHATRCSTLGFKVEESNVAHVSRLERSDEVEALYTAFVQRLWEAFPPHGPVRVREFDDYRAARRSTRRSQAVPVTLIPFRNLTVAVNGDFTIFAGELLFRDDDRFAFGNVLNGPLLDCLKSARFRTIGAEILSGVQRCATSCAHYVDCGSFYISQKHAETGTFDTDETLACRLEVKGLFRALDGVQ